MRTFVNDLLILTLIGGAVAALMLLPPRTLRRIEKNWGKVVFDDPVTFAEADTLTDILVRANVFNGQDLTHRLTKQDDTLTWSLMFHRDYEKLFAEHKVGPNPKAQLIGFVEEVCYRAFPNQRVKVDLIGKDLQTFEELIAPTVYRAEPVGHVGDRSHQSR